jgi:geranylgeranyl pyrophosphate synthase
MSSVIIHDHIEDVFNQAENLAMSLATVKRQREILRIAFRGARAKETSFPVFIHFPLLMYGLFREDMERAIPVAGVTTLFYMGLDIFDDIADGDLPKDIWEGIGDEELNQTAATLFFSLPALAIRKLEIPEITKTKMQEALAKGFLAVASGQIIDMHCAGAGTVSPDEIKNSVVLKTGEQLAMYARLAAMLADASEEQVERCASLGRAYGTALQFGSDIYDIFAAHWSRDLASGTRTLPIALFMNSLDKAGREEFVKLLYRAQTDRSAQEVVRENLIKNRVLQKMAFITEHYSKEALAHFDMLSSNTLSADELRTQIETISYVNWLIRQAY